MGWLQSKNKVNTNEEGIDKEWLEKKRKREEEIFKAKAKSAKFILIEIVISCQNLVSLDTFSAADPLIAFYTEDGYETNNWVYKGQTEGLKDTPNPTFQKSITLTYYFDTEERIKLELYDVDNFKEGVPLKKHTFVADSIVKVGDIIKAGILVTKFKNDSKPKFNKTLEK